MPAQLRRQVVSSSSLSSSFVFLLRLCGVSRRAREVTGLVVVPLLRRFGPGSGFCYFAPNICSSLPMWHCPKFAKGEPTGRLAPHHGRKDDHRQFLAAPVFNAIDDKARSLQSRDIASRHPVILIEAPDKPIANTCLVVAEGFFEHDCQQVFSQIVRPSPVELMFGLCLCLA